MDALKSLVSQQGCAADGSVVASNPVGAMVDGLTRAYPGAGPGAGSGAGAGVMQGPRGPVFEMEGGAAHPDVFQGPRIRGPRHAPGPHGAGPMAMHADTRGMSEAWDAAAAGGGAASGGPASAPQLARAHSAGSMSDSGSGAGSGGGMMMHHGGMPMGGMPMMGGPMGMGPMMGGPMGMGMMGMGGMGMMGGPRMMGGGMMHQHSMPMQPPATPIETITSARAVTYDADTAEEAGPEEAAPADSEGATASATPSSGTDLEELYARELQARGLGPDERAAEAAEAESDDATAAQMRGASRQLADHLASRDDPRFQQSELVSFLSQMGHGEVEIAGDTVVPASAETTAAARQEAAADAEAQEVAKREEEAKFADMWRRAMAGEEVDMSQMWARALGDDSAASEMESWLQDMRDGEDGGATDRKELEAAWEEAAAAESSQPAELKYALAEDNPYAEDPDAFELGMRLFEEGKLRQAVLAFESVVAKHPEHSEAWRMLGVCHAESDEDRRAIVCLEKAVEQDPYNLEASLALGVSYVNELDHEKALKNLQAWVKHNPKFAGLKFEADAYSDGTLMDEVMQLMLKAQDWDSGDPEVKVVLGVLYNVSRDYDSAIASFAAALDARPDDYSLWNKLGATRANSTRSKEALPAYRRALELKPTYARGWLNLGISHANLGDYEAAAKAYLQALKLNPDATHIWNYVRIAFTCMERFDLVELSEKGDVRVFEPFLAGN